MSDLSDYTDVREGMPHLQAIPCRDCQKTLYVPWDFPEDDWWCEACEPEKLQELDTRPRVEVRI